MPLAAALCEMQAAHLQTRIRMLTYNPQEHPTGGKRQAEQVVDVVVHVHYYGRSPTDVKRWC